MVVMILFILEDFIRWVWQFEMVFFQLRFVLFFAIDMDMERAFLFGLFFISSGIVDCIWSVCYVSRKDIHDIGIFDDYDLYVLHSEKTYR